MRRILALMLFSTMMGCAGEPTPPPVAGESPDRSIETGASEKDVSVRPVEPPWSYPEKAEVERLLIQASNLESHGKFAEALAVATQAVSIDPNSPTANEAKARLEDLLRRIQGPARMDGREDPAAIVQRSTP